MSLSGKHLCIGAQCGIEKAGQEMVGCIRNHYHSFVRNTKRKYDEIKANKLFEASMLGDANLLTELKRIRSGGYAALELPDTVAGANGEKEIVLKCCDIYSLLYNSAGTQKGMEDLKKEVSQSIGEEKHEIDKVTATVVKEAVMSMKSKKSDVTESFTSDALLEGPDIRFQHLSLVFKDWLYQY